MRSDFMRIYAVMMGFENASSEDVVRDEFSGKKCEELYDKAYRARIRITVRLGGALHADDDPDALCMTNAYEEMMFLMCKKAFEYGQLTSCMQKNCCRTKRKFNTKYPHFFTQTPESRKYKRYSCHI